MPITVLKKRTPRLNAYSRKVLGTSAANLIAYWPLWEAGGTAADNLEGTVARDGTYSGATLAQVGAGDGKPAPSFDGTNDYVDIYSTSLNSAWDYNTLTVMAWGKVSGAGVWEDSTARRLIAVGIDATNYFTLGRAAANNDLAATVVYNSDGKSSTKSSVSTTGWFNLIATVGSGDLLLYYDGSAIGAATGSVDTGTGTLVQNRCNIGARISATTEPWSGYIAHVAIWDKVLSSSEITALATMV